MSAPRLTTTEGVLVDLTALRAWHFRCSLDPDRAPTLRRWHRAQVDIISRKMPKRKPKSWSPAKQAMVELLAEAYRKKIFERSGHLATFNWQKFCEAARKSAQVKLPE